MGDAATINVSIQDAGFDAAREAEALCQGRADVGAVVTFTGKCRDEGGRLAALELEHYPGMAEAEIERIAAKAAERWPVTGIRVIHRFGRIAPGADIVLVVTASAHRHAAFQAAAFLMDYLKTRAPFWKKEHPADGSPAGDWVSAKDEDDTALERWREAGTRRPAAE